MKKKSQGIPLSTPHKQVHIQFVYLKLFIIFTKNDIIVTLWFYLQLNNLNKLTTPLIKISLLKNGYIPNN